MDNHYTIKQNEIPEFEDELEAADWHEEQFDLAVDAFPEDLDRTSIESGDLEPDEEGNVDFATEYTFDIETFFGYTVKGGGWIYYKYQDGRTDISSSFVVLLNWQPLEQSHIAGVYNGSWNFRMESH